MRSHVLVSGRFDGGDKEAKARAINRQDAEVLGAAEEPTFHAPSLG